MRFIAICVLAATILLTPIGFTAEQSAQEFLASIAEIPSEPVRQWRYLAQDVPGAQTRNFDDSAWKVGDPDLVYGMERVAWVRKKIVLPEEIGGFSVAGRGVALEVGADDDGDAYVDGKLVRKFHGEEGYIVLTENARPGQCFVVAIRIANFVGPGRLVLARLTFVDTMAEDARRFSQDMQVCDSMIKSKLWPMDPSYADALGKCSLDIDRDAGGRRDSAAFLASLGKAGANLKPFADIANDYTCHMIGHAHIDMNWLWLWPETVEVCQNTSASVVNFMREYPEFKFSLSQASTYAAVQSTKPELFAQIKKYVREGRWEIVGGTWVEGDLNMASGESIVRQILLAKQYFRENFGKQSNICWMPDTFGHPWSMPQIVKKSGLDYYMFMRCGIWQPVFWWEGIDGSRILALNASYTASVGNQVPMHTMETATLLGGKDAPLIYGVGDHGGGPTRRDIERAIDLRKRAVGPKVKFSTVDSFFQSALAQNRNYPVHRNELNFQFRGCYTTHGDIKLMNRRSENMLPTAEAFSTIAGWFGMPYPLEDYRESWRRTCFNQFHDILCGSAIHGAFDYSRGLFEKTEKQVAAALKSSLKQIVGKVDTRGQGVPIVVFNPLAWTRTDIVETSYHLSVNTGESHLVDAKGRKLPAQRRGNVLSFVARDVPSMGYRVYWLRRGPAKGSSSISRAAFAASSCLIENDLLRVTVSRQSGAITSVCDKSAGREVIKSGLNGDVLQALAEKPVGMSGWDIGDIKETLNLSKPESVEVVQNGPVVSTIRVRHKFGASTFSQDIKLYAGVPRVDIKMTADWREVGTLDTGSTMMKTAFNVNVDNGRATYEIPFGSIERKADGSEVPAQKWIDLSNDCYGVSLLNDCKYGHDVLGSAMRLTLLRNSYDPDPLPDVGVHKITYALYPHTGDWRQAGTVRRAYELNNPLVAMYTTTHRGPLGSECSFLSVSPGNVIVTAFKRSEDGQGMALRFYESSGSPTTAQVRVSAAKTWREVNLVESGGDGKSRKLPKTGQSIPLGKYEIKTLLLR